MAEGGLTDPPAHVCRHEDRREQQSPQELPVTSLMANSGLTPRFDSPSTMLMLKSVERERSAIGFGLKRAC